MSGRPCQQLHNAFGATTIGSLGLDADGDGMIHERVLAGMIVAWDGSTKEALEVLLAGLSSRSGSQGDGKVDQLVRVRVAGVEYRDQVGRLYAGGGAI